MLWKKKLKRSLGEMMGHKHCFHHKQIPTTYRKLEQITWIKGSDAVRRLIDIFRYEPDSPEYKNCIVMAAVLFEQISCLVYNRSTRRDFSRKYYHKPDVKWYKEEIFEGPVETVEEVSLRLAKSHLNGADPKYVHTIIWQIADLVCPMMADEGEQAFVSEYAYAIDYVIKHKGDLEKPEMDFLFPKNYDDFRPQEGIGGEVSKYEFLT